MLKCWYSWDQGWASSSTDGGPIWRDVLYGFPVFILAVFGIYGIAAAVSILIGLIGLILILPAELLGRALARPNIDVWIKFATAAAILGGFHFDLLAS